MCRAKTERKKRKKKYLEGALEVYIVIKAECVKISNITRAGIPESYISSQTGKLEEGILIVFIVEPSGP